MWDAPTREEVAQLADSFIREWLEVAQEEGWEIPQPKGH